MQDLHLDGWSERELTDFYMKWTKPPSREVAVSLVGAIPQPELAVHHLANYARYKVLAMGQRITGRISRAVELEQAADRHYEALPLKLRW